MVTLKVVLWSEAPGVTFKVVLWGEATGATGNAKELHLILVVMQLSSKLHAF
jgi:hypothetical protein